MKALIKTEAMTDKNNFTNFASEQLRHQDTAVELQGNKLDQNYEDGGKRNGLRVEGKLAQLPPTKKSST